MEFFVVFQGSVLPIFIIIFVAILYKKLFQPEIKQITDLALTVFAPIFVFHITLKYGLTLKAMTIPVLFMVILTASMIVISYLLGRLMRLDKNDMSSFVLACSMINIGNFGLPLIHFTYGEQAVAYSVLYFLAFNISLCTVAIVVSSDSYNIRSGVVSLVRMPLFHAFFLSLLCVQLSIPIPQVIDKSFALAGQAAIPLLIFILGLQLADIRLKIRVLKIIGLIAVIRLLVSPAIAYPLLRSLGVDGVELQVATLQSSAPSALLPLMYAIKFNRSPELLAAAILATTVLSSVTLSGLIQWLG